MHIEKKISSKLEHKGNILTFYTDTVELENGKNATRDVIRHKGAVCIAPLTDNGELLFVSQYRYPIARELLELPAGKRDSYDEDPLDCAHRELEEETGMKAGEMIHLGAYLPAAAYCDEKIDLYLARGLYQGKANPDDDEFIDVIKFPIERAVDMIMSGEIDDGKTQTLVLKVVNYLKK